MSVVIPRSNWQIIEPGVVVVRCPECDLESSLMSLPIAGEMAGTHNVDGEGDVTPSMVCPREGCSWHVFGTLEGWADVMSARDEGEERAS